MTTPINVAMVGLDTSHTVEFSRRMNDPECPAHERVPDLHANTCLRFPSPFQDEKGQDERQAKIEAWGVEVTRDFDAAVAGCDAIMLEVNEPAAHLPYFERVAKLGKPVFVDKPLADTVANGKRILEIAREQNVPLWSSSSLRFVTGLIEARQAVAEPLSATFFGPLGKAASGSDIIWYGVHTVEMLTSAMGPGAATVRAVKDGQGAVAVLQYDDDRRGIVEFNTGIWTYGGRIASADGVAAFQVGSDPGLYNNLLARMRDFFLAGEVPVPWEETLEVTAILETVERALASGDEEPLSQ